MSKIKWVITVDHINDGEEVGTGPGTIGDDSLTERFRIYMKQNMKMIHMS